ncbi:MAG: HD-GYP domain-containing protein, partial [Candidatus Xenobia bacterium]
VIRSHHERLDGTGYPDGLKGSQIPVIAQVSAICDIYDALATARSYKRAFPPEMCYDILKSESRKGWWDGELVELLFKQLAARNIASIGGRRKTEETAPTESQPNGASKSPLVEARDKSKDPAV